MRIFENIHLVMEGILMKEPRWINEIPNPIPINEKVEITDEMKKRGRRIFKSC
jgi:hypothetical protein